MKSSGDARAACAATIASEVVAQLSLPRGADWGDVIRSVETRSGKRLLVMPVAGLSWTTISGLWFGRADVDTVVYRPEDPALFQQHSVFHEFGHILLGHKGCAVLDEVPRDVLASTGVSGAIASVRAKGLFVDDDEIAAEEVATAIARVMLSSGQGGLSEAFG